MTDRNNRLDWTLLLPSSLELPVEDVLVLGGTATMADDLVVPWRVQALAVPHATSRQQQAVAGDQLGRGGLRQGLPRLRGGPGSAVGAGDAVHVLD